jgi:hypothetical protein
MSGILSSDGGDGARLARCGGCGALAVGPCARCRMPVCGDCCVLTRGGAGPWAICRGCEDRHGASLRGAWGMVLGWLVKPMLLLLLVYVVLRWLF